MLTYVARIWVPDRPGALGAVASRIGAVRGDVVGIEILERGGGLAIDELLIELPSPELVPLLVDEMSQVDGVDVEDVRPVATPMRDPMLDALHTAAMLVEQVSVPALLELLVDQAHRDFQADWSVVLDLEDAATLVVVGEPPAPSWLRAFVSGGRASSSVATGECGPDDVGWAHLPAAELAVVLGRRSRAFRARERRRLVALAKIANHRWAELTGRQSRTLHPSAT